MGAYKVAGTSYSGTAFTLAGPPDWETCAKDWQARATAAEAENARLRNVVRMYMAVTPEHDYSCSIGPIYRCTCDLHEANEAARAALETDHG